MTPTEPSFEDSLTQLALIIQILERGQPTLEESLTEFERGVQLLQRCRFLLDAADRRIHELVEIDEQGRARLKPFVHEATATKEMSPAKRPKKSAKTPEPTSENEPDLFGS
ncbi:exodeoxyribonuclease VII small subunit [bacterium]|jgi:exodeoxyribonuclease VII small subunit|nr:exodeoxyribonuclease VII small subunit [bacterium]